MVTPLQTGLIGLASFVVGLVWLWIHTRQVRMLVEAGSAVETPIGAKYLLLLGVLLVTFSFLWTCWRLFLRKIKEYPAPHD